MEKASGESFARKIRKTAQDGDGEEMGNDAKHLLNSGPGYLSLAASGTDWKLFARFFRKSSGILRTKCETNRFCF
jgi:hypothetical protein